MMPVVNLQKWIEENKDSLHPPVNNKMIQVGKDFFVMAVGGPNARTDYHINETEEWFYQIKGNMILNIIEEDVATGRPAFVPIIIKEGELYLHPGNVPHNPCRFEDTVGLVIERSRPANALDKVQWYCSVESCRNLLHSVEFHAEDLGEQLKEEIGKYVQNDKARTCSNCGKINSHLHENLIYPQ